MEGIKFRDIMLVIILAILIFLFVWKIFGKSPSFEQISMAFTLFFLILAFESRADSKDLKRYGLATLSKLDKLNKLEVLDDIKIELNKINKKL